MSRFVKLILAIAITTLVAACSILKGNDSEKEVRTFLSLLQSDLTKSDDEILSHFRVKQSKDAVIAVIRILQNRDPFIHFDGSLNNSLIVTTGNTIRVETFGYFQTKGLENEDSASSTLIMWLSPSEDGYHVTQIAGEEFYQEFLTIKNNNQWQTERKLALQERTWIYETAKELESIYDTVIWFTQYRDKKYFYVVEGSWTNYFLNYSDRNTKNSSVKMGLVDEKGNLVVPLNYDLIGSPGFAEGNILEVKRNGKVGYFNIETHQELLEPVYDFIIPYGVNNVKAVVRRDGVYGWLDASYQFTEGFTNTEMEDWIKNFRFLNDLVVLKPGNHPFNEIPFYDYAGNGIIVPPAYLSHFKIFDEIESGISTTEVPINGWTEYKETKRSFLETLSSNLKAVITTVEERYLEGREEFYTSSQLLFVNNQLDTISTAIVSGDELSLSMVDSTLLEVRSPHDYWFMENDVCDEYNLLEHTYFSFAEGQQVTPLTSKRLFSQTQFVKLDSSYLIGRFKVYNPETKQDVESAFLSARTISYMRDEILAEYGYGFVDPDRDSQFNHLRKEDDPRIADLNEIITQMSEVDKHNYDFLNRVLELMKPSA